jgi:hypothetical protein
MTDQAWLQRAAEHLFLCGVGDAAEQLCEANMTRGIARIQFAEDRLGLAPRAHFIGAPDATVTRNTYRWRHGFGYGGLVSWDREIAVLDSKPNGCGMLVGALASAPHERDVREAARAARGAALELDGVELTYDLGESNHFVDGLELDQQLEPAEEELPPHLFVIHSSGHEHRPSSPFGPGLYIDESEELSRMAETVATPWGPVALLRGDDASRYHRFCARVQRFNADRRGLYGRLLFGDHDVVCNETHQGMRDDGRLHLGAYWFESQERLFPLTLGPDQPLYLLRPTPNLSDGIIDELGWRERAERLDLMEALRSANILPHGGGYRYPHLRRLLRVEERGTRRVFWLEPSDGGLPVGVEDVRPLPFAYRDLAVLHRLMELKLATPVARYRIRFVVKE